MGDAQPLKLVGFPYKSSKNRQKWNFTKSKIGADWTVNLDLLITNVKKSFENSHPVATRSLWSWSDSHTNRLKITKNEISRNQKSPQIARYFLRPWLWIRRDFLKIPIQRPTLSVSREGGAILYTKKMQKRCFFLPKNAKKGVCLTNKCKRDVSFYQKTPKRRSF